MSLTLRINAVWLLTWLNTGNYKTINEKVNGTLAIYWKWWDITEFTHRIMYYLVPNRWPCSKSLGYTPSQCLSTQYRLWYWSLLVWKFNTHGTHRRQNLVLPAAADSWRAVFLCPLIPLTAFILSKDHTWPVSFESTFEWLLGRIPCRPLGHSIHWKGGLQHRPADSNLALSPSSRRIWEWVCGPWATSAYRLIIGCGTS